MSNMSNQTPNCVSYVICLGERTCAAWLAGDHGRARDIALAMGECVAAIPRCVDPAWVAHAEAALSLARRRAASLERDGSRTRGEAAALRSVIACGGGGSGLVSAREADDYFRREAEAAEDWCAEMRAR